MHHLLSKQKSVLQYVDNPWTVQALVDGYFDSEALVVRRGCQECEKIQVLAVVAEIRVRKF